MYPPVPTLPCLPLAHVPSTIPLQMALQRDATPRSSFCPTRDRLWVELHVYIESKAPIPKHVLVSRSWRHLFYISHNIQIPSPILVRVTTFQGPVSRSPCHTPRYKLKGPSETDHRVGRKERNHQARSLESSNRNPAARTYNIDALSHTPKSFHLLPQAHSVHHRRRGSTGNHAHCQPLEDLTMNYPDPPQGVYPPTSMDMGISPESYGTYPRPAHDTYPTSMAYEANALYADGPYMYPDDEMRVPSSNLSSASASSSNMGSPLSNHGQLAPMPDWAAPQGLSSSPGIVDQNDYFAGTEYSFAPCIDGFNAHFDFAQAKGPGFVGELSQIPRSSLSSPASSSCTVVPELGLPRKSSLVMASPTTPASSPPLPAWSSPCQDGMSPIVRNHPAPLFSPFFSQSSGHFVPPLESSCWFPLV